MSSEEMLKPCRVCAGEGRVFVESEHDYWDPCRHCRGGGKVCVECGRYPRPCCPSNTRAAVPSVSCEKLEALVAEVRSCVPTEPPPRGSYKAGSENALWHIVRALEALIEESRRGA